MIISYEYDRIYTTVIPWVWVGRNDLDFVSCICCLAVFSYYVDYIDVLFLDLMDGGRSDCWEMLGASDDTNNCTSIYTALTTLKG